jgi:uridylate kinase
MTTVISLGGSIVAPDGPDPAYVADFVALVRSYLEGDEARRLILVVGGGGPARLYQKALRDVVARDVIARDAAVRGEAAARANAEPPSDEAQDWIGIMATRLNAQLVKAALGELCPQEVVIDPEALSVFRGRVLVGAGWKPGFSTDYDAVLLAQKLDADRVLNLSNVAQVFTADPRRDPSAKALDAISWADFRALTGETWVPGKNTPFDPVASRAAAESRIAVVCASGRDLANLRSILEGGGFVGTTIGPD